MHFLSVSHSEILVNSSTNRRPYLGLRDMPHIVCHISRILGPFIVHLGIGVSTRATRHMMLIFSGLRSSELAVKLPTAV